VNDPDYNVRNVSDGCEIAFAPTTLDASSGWQCGNGISQPTLRNVIKQSILLEEHIAEKNKYCIACIIKHFQHIVGLLEEAVWLAGKNIDKYPLLEGSPEFYQHIFEVWLSNRHDETTKKQVLDAIRERRRKLIEIYYIST
jgi:hypothetical protein